MKFQNIYYDYKANKIHHWYRDDDGCNRKEIVTPKIEYYVKDKSGQSPIHDIYGTPVILQTTENRFKLRDIKSFTQTYESDSISEEIKFLQKRYKDIDMKADLNDFQIGTIDIESQTEKEFKIENIADYKINLISIHLSKTNQVYTFGIYPYTGKSETVKNYYYIPDEKRMIETFIKFAKKNKVHLYTGWNCSRYDIPHIIKRSEKLGIEVSLSPVGIYREKSGAAGYHVDGGGYEVAGITILDGLDLYKNFEREKRQSYSLDAIGLIEVGEGKIGYEGSINNFWKNDWNKFVEYNIQDVLLTKKINDKKRYIELAIEICYQSLVPFEKVVSSVNVETGSITRYLHKHNMVLSDKPNVKVKAAEKLPGALVMADVGLHRWCMNMDVESMYPHLIMRYGISPETLVLNPTNPNGLIKTPVEGVYYRKDIKGVIPQIVEKTFKERKRFKHKASICYLLEKNITDIEELIKNLEGFSKDYIVELLKEIEIEKGTEEYYDRQQYIRKIKINATFGILANEHFVYYNINNAKVITLGGQSLIKFLRDTANDYFKSNINLIIKKCWPDIKKEIQLENGVVCLLDTDSNFLCFDEIITKLGITFSTMQEFREWCLTLNSKVLEPFYDRILKIYFKRYNVDEIVNFRKEKIISKMVILAKKKYAMKIIDKEGKYFDPPKLAFTGIEIVRTDTPVFCRSKLQSVVDEIFETEDYYRVTEMMSAIKEVYMKATADDIAVDEDDEYDDNSVDEIALAKGVKNYTKYAKETDYYIQHGLEYEKGTPIHVRASINYNYMITKYNLPLMPITNGTKMRFVHVHSKKNELRQNVVGFIGKWPKEFNEFFEIDNEEMWNKTFQNVIQRFFDVLKWGKINLNYCGITLDSLMNQEGGNEQRAIQSNN